MSHDDALVSAWRLEQALHLDVPLEDAERFADSAGDLALLRRLVAAGCEPRLAVQIVI